MKPTIAINRREMTIGALLVFLGALMPIFLNVQNMGIYPTLFVGLEIEEIYYVLYAAFKLVMMNALRSFPHYLGAFLIGDAVHISRGGREIRMSKVFIVCGLIPLVYFSVGFIYNIRYDFGMPAFLVIAMLLILGRINFNMVNITKKTLMVVMMVIAFQWLDVIPALGPYNMGRGETSQDIKAAAVILGEGDKLGSTALLFFGLFFVTALLLCLLIMDQNKLMLVSEENRRSQEQLMDTRMRVLESRTYIELQTLVHDLKSPLTSIQALVGAVKLGTRDTESVDYLTKIESSVERMSDMISEILYGDYRRETEVGDLLESLLSQISGSEYRQLVEVVDLTGHQYISVNIVYFTRAIINLLENAFYAVDPGCGRIWLTAEPYMDQDIPSVRLTVRDNGRGIPAGEQLSIWESGYSTRGSLGLGLGFVRKVVEDNGGRVSLVSHPDRGTAVSVVMPAVRSRNSHTAVSAGGEHDYG